MIHRLGEIDLVRWQGRRNRRLRSGLSGWTVLLAACALVGAAMLGAQLFGLLPLNGAAALTAAAFLLLALGAQIIVLVRAALSWLAG